MCCFRVSFGGGGGGWVSWRWGRVGGWGIVVWSLFNLSHRFMGGVA